MRIAFAVIDVDAVAAQQTEVHVHVEARTCSMDARESTACRTTGAAV